MAACGATRSVPWATRKARFGGMNGHSPCELNRSRLRCTFVIKAVPESAPTAWLPVARKRRSTGVEPKADPHGNQPEIWPDCLSHGAEQPTSSEHVRVQKLVAE